MAAYVWIAIGGALGSMARSWCFGLVTQHGSETACHCRAALPYRLR